jgi:hypothetical protein
MICLGLLFNFASLGLAVYCVWPRPAPRQPPAAVSVTERQGLKSITGEDFSQPVGR